MLEQLKVIEFEYNQMKEEEKRLNEVINIRDNTIQELRKQIEQLKGVLFQTNKGCKTISSLIQIENKRGTSDKTFLNNLDKVAHKTRDQALKIYNRTGVLQQ